MCNICNDKIKGGDYNYERMILNYETALVKYQESELKLDLLYVKLEEIEFENVKLKCELDELNVFNQQFQAEMQQISNLDHQISQSITNVSQFLSNTHTILNQVIHTDIMQVSKNYNLTKFPVLTSKLLNCTLKTSRVVRVKLHTLI